MFLCPLSVPNGKAHENRGAEDVHSVGNIARQASREVHIYSGDDERVQGQSQL